MRAGGLPPWRVTWDVYVDGADASEACERALEAMGLVVVGAVDAPNYVMVEECFDHYGERSFRLSQERLEP